ncbi:MAG TPA: UvrD-helicase domain-containing protein [Polyangia bacterium]|jgi:exodeoxyribonuclease V beta subunit|nr:UvrD-helicase domain-containing protein [Polyangia bacterium]
MILDDVPSYAFPEELLRLPRDASGVVEASAGTGKTYLLEHLVVDRIVRGEARVDEILVVTFTEKATDELRRRLRLKLDELLAHTAPAPAGADATARWHLDEAARRRLIEARNAFDRATIRTIHGFCEQVLREVGFVSGRLLTQEHVDGQRVFTEAFKTALRTTLATEPATRAYLAAWIEAGRTIEDLGLTLFRAHQQRLPWGVVYDEAELSRAAAAYGALTDDEIAAAVRSRVTHASSSKAIIERAVALRDVCGALAAHDDLPTLLRAVDELVKTKEVFTWLEERLPPPHASPLREFWRAFVAVADAAVPLELAVAQLFLPSVAALLDARKATMGLYDFDDMVAQVAATLRGPDGERLVASLRARYRFAVIDEFQDTDAVQWEIFRRVFHASGGSNPLYVIGDPKQAIYGFRGADVAAYAEARRAITGGDAPTVTLRRNFRSRQAVLDATNAIFDADSAEPYFAEPDLRPAPALRGSQSDDAPGLPEAITLLAVEPRPGADVSKLPMRQVRRTLTTAIAAEIGRLVRAPGGPAPSQIFVLTRARIESMQVARALREAGLPHVLYNQEGLFGTAEAREVRDLLAAVDEPRDAARRLRAWLTPFFGLALGDLPSCVPLPGGHALEERLHAWRAVAETRDFNRLFDRVVDDSGVAQRELLGGAGARRITNYLHLFDLLRARAARGAASLSDLVGWLGALTEQVAVPLPEEGDVQRIEGERDAVQIMTVHKAKGLEADHVFLYGAFGKFMGQGVKTFGEAGARKLYAGRPRRVAIEAALEAETASEDQRLLYVALTRARRHLYLPYAASDDLEREGRKDDGYWRITGGYRHVHKRLRSLADLGDEAARLSFRRLPLVCPPDVDDTPARVARAVGAWRPAPADLTIEFPAAALAETRRRHTGIVMTSYTRIKQAHGGYQPPTEVLDEQPTVAEAPPDPGRLPGGALSGIFLHAALEEIPLQTFTADAGWSARDEVRAVFDAAMRRHDRDPAHRADAERMVHAAFTTPLALPSGATLAGVARAARVAREVEFLFPFPAAAGGADAGFVKGYVDFIFEHEGRTYFGDWKSDLLPDFSPEAVRAHVATNYELQRRLYALALVKMLGIADAADYEARFGGTVYVFLRALPDGLEIGRPSFDDIVRWERELAEQLAAERGAA